MNKKLIIAIAIVALLVGGVIGLLGKKQEKTLGVGSNGINVIDGNPTSAGSTTTPAGNSGLPVQVLARNNSRQYAVICNDDSTNNVYLTMRDFTSPTAAGTNVSGTIRINSGGGCYEILPENLFLGQVWATSTARSVKILFLDK